MKSHKISITKKPKAINLFGIRNVQPFPSAQTARHLWALFFWLNMFRMDFFLGFSLLVQLPDHFCTQTTLLLMPQSSVGVRKQTAKRITTARLQGKA